MKKIINQSILPIVLIIGLLTTTAFKTQDNSDLFEITKNLEIFTNIYKELNTHYVDEIDPSHLMGIGIDAMMKSLDPYTVYYSENQIERYKYITEGRYDGIGADVKFLDNYITLTELYKGYAADRKELKVGDQIIAVDGKSVAGMQRDEVSMLMKGSKGQDMQLEIRRPIIDSTFTVDIPRDEVTTPNVPYSGMVDDEVGYVVLSIFTKRASANVEKAVKKLKSDNPELKSVILDLRGNGGGLLSEAVSICNLFLPSDKLVVSTKSKVKDWDKTYKTKKQPLDLDIPITVLVDNKSASASEIVSGTLQDYDRAVIMGQQTYGKGLVQNRKKVGYNSGIKLTTAKYFIPSGRCIQSVEYEDGEPVDIHDSLRAEFKTMNGRTVLDGGGIRPDVKLTEKHPAPLIKELEEQSVIMKYVTQYIHNNPEAPEEDGITFDDFDDFKEFTEEIDFTFETKSERTLHDLEKKLKDEAYYRDVEDELSSISDEMRQAKENSMDAYEDRIVDLIEEEIMSRYYYQDGKIKQRLEDDEEVDAAIALLKDQERYKNTLNITE